MQRRLTEQPRPITELNPELPAYVRKVIETVGTFDNVIYEISNESHGGSTAWQCHWIARIREIEAKRGKRHPVWMSFQLDGASGMGSNQTHHFTFQRGQHRFKKIMVD